MMCDDPEARADGGGPLVSVIMPVYNAGAYLRPAVESVLGQTHRNLELILIDDGSTDGCVAALDDIQDPRLRRIRQDNAGKPVAMNLGLSLARGEFYALNDADDLSHSLRLQRQLACLLANPEVAGVFCGHELILDDQVVAPTFHAKSPEECAQDIALGQMPAHDPTAMYRLALVAGMCYSQDLPVVEGYDYTLRVGERFPLMVCGECLYQYRVHAESVTHKDPAYRDRKVQEVLDRMCDRRGQPRRLALRFNSGGGDALRAFDNGIVSHFMVSVADQMTSGQRINAVRTGLVIWRRHPASLYYAKPLICSLMPHTLMRFYRWVKTRTRKQRRSVVGSQTTTQGSGVPWSG